MTETGPVRSSPASRPGVKICGLTRVEDAEWAEGCGASHVGVILAGGPRLVSEAQARTVLGPRRPSLRRVAVFGDQPMDQVARVATALALDVIQLHGGATPDAIAWLRQETGCRVWPVLRVGADGLPREADALAASAGALVLDTLVPGQLGGTGVPLAWDALSAPLAALRGRVGDVELVVAGGLTPDNVARAVHLLVPTCVDVSSGVEAAPGVKDPARVQAFVRAAAGSRET